MIAALFALTTVLFSLYSYVLIDANITLLSHPAWTVFRNITISFGYYQRSTSFIVYLLLLLFFFLLQFLLVKKNRINPLHIAITIGAVVLVSYPFLSHDMFNYMFDARIATFYHQNPYVHRALDFPTDHWLRFMHWTHRSYPYGPVFLVITLVPSFLSMGRLLTSFLFFKIVWVGFYLIAVYSLSKINKRTALFFATSPLIIIEGLINMHNDLIAVSLGILSVTMFIRGRSAIAWICMLLSIGIKYTTLPFVFLLIKNKWMPLLSISLFSFGIAFLATKTGLYAWYFLALFLVLPYYKERAYVPLTVLSVFLLLSYYPYIALGFWNKHEYIVMKDAIIWLGIIATGISFLFVSRLHRSESD